jgi:hypothetical protein
MLLDAWRVDGEPRPEVAPIWGHLLLLRKHRNIIHLSRAAEEQTEWQAILQAEPEIVAAAESSIAHLQGLCHVFRDDA